MANGTFLSQFEGSNGGGMRRSKRKLWIEVVSARNLENHAAVDAYCLVRLGKSAYVRSTTCAASTPTPTWRHEIEFDAPENNDQLLTTSVVVEVRTVKDFFFDMFPSSNAATSICNSTITNGSVVMLDECFTPEKYNTDHDSNDMMDMMDHCNGSNLPQGNSEIATQMTARSKRNTKTKPPPQQPQDSTDETIGTVEIHLASLCKPSRAATDRWYGLRGTHSGEIRVRTVCYEVPCIGQDEETRIFERELREKLLNEYVYEHVQYDHYGFKIPEQLRKEYAHLLSYYDCREERRICDWEAALDSQSNALHFANEDKLMVQQMARAGIPRHWRQRIYMIISGATKKRESETPNYYQTLLQQAESMESLAFRQIDLDIDRTFGHSATKVCTDAGRAELRRILQAFSLRNSAVGYCQGLNFIAGFLSLGVDEESAFWLLVIICEDYYPGYYTSTMTDIQTDMLVLKQLIKEELPLLDEFTDDVGLPLELLGSQWLLCLFTTTFPSETVFRIFDCIFTEGPHIVFAVIMAHLRRLEPALIGLHDFQSVLSSIKEAENALFDADEFIAAVAFESTLIQKTRIQALREKHRISVRDEMERAARARALNQQLAAVYEIPAFSSYAASLLRFFHEEAEVSSRSDVAFILTLLCHGLVWLAEQSRHWRK